MKNYLTTFLLTMGMICAKTDHAQNAQSRPSTQMSWRLPFNPGRFLNLLDVDYNTDKTYRLRPYNAQDSASLVDHSPLRCLPVHDVQYNDDHTTLTVYREKGRVATKEVFYSTRLDDDTTKDAAQGIPDLVRMEIEATDKDGNLARMQVETDFLKTDCTDTKARVTYEYRYAERGPWTGPSHIYSFKSIAHYFENVSEVMKTVRTADAKKIGKVLCDRAQHYDKTAQEVTQIWQCDDKIAPVAYIL